MRPVFLTGASLIAVAAVQSVTTSAVDPKIPVCAGLTTVGAVNEPRGDYEPITTVTSVTPQAITWSYSNQTSMPDGSLRDTHVHRTVLVKDLRSAAMVVRWMDPSAPVTIPGSTMSSVSTAVLRALKATGSAEISLVDRDNSALPAERNRHPNIYETAIKYRFQRVGSEPEHIPVIVNDARIDLPVIHARGSYLGDYVELFILDDEDYPMTVKAVTWSGPAGTVNRTESRTVKISFRCDAAKTMKGAPPPSRIEQALLTTGRADVYDLYFDFNSDSLRQESEPTLGEIADVLRRHPDWKLSVEGHTDNIGTDQANLDLSRRRAASVKAALTSRYQVAGSRLTTEGYGESRPQDTNDTLEGRARNRRVELVRR
ncbi:MAG TPA: OmpA family protein [Vicinamibacterales bacterium]|nr:OmpA family protein [Vicinamibacterales bacterium]